MRHTITHDMKRRVELRLRARKRSRQGHRRSIATAGVFTLLGFLPQFGHAQGRPDLVWMRGGDSYPYSLSLTADGQTIVSGSGPTVKFRRVSDGYLTRTMSFPQFTYGVSVAAISPDGQYLYVGGSQITTVINDLSILIRLSDESVVWTVGGYLRNPRFSGDGKYIGDLKNEYVLRASDGVTVIANQEGGYNYGDFSADGKGFVAGADDGTNARFTLFDLPSLSYHFWKYLLPNNYQSRAQYAAYSPDRSKVVSFLSGNNYVPGLYILNTEQASGTYPLATLPIPAYAPKGGQPYPSYVISPVYWNTGGIFSLFGTAVDANGNIHGSVVDYEAVRYDPTTYARTRIFKLTADTDGVSPYGFVLTPDGTRMATGGAATFRPDGSRYANPQGRIRVYDTSNSSLLYLMDKDQTSFVYGVAISPDGQTVATGAYDGTINLWNRADGSFLLQMDANSSVSSVAFSPDGTTLVSAGGSRNAIGDGNLKIWRVSDGALLKTIHGAEDRLYTVKYSPDGTMIATGGYANMAYARLYSAATGQLLRTFTMDYGTSVANVAFSPDGSLLAASNNGRCQIWRVSDGVQQGLYSAGGNATPCTFSPDNAKVAFTNGNQIKIVNVATGVTLQTLNGHTSDATSLAFSPDGQTLLSGGFDATIRFWNVNTGAALKYYDKETSIGRTGAQGVMSVAFAPDGRFFTYTRDDSTTVTARNPYFVPLTITAPGVSNVTDTSATPNWMTNLAANSVVDYGVSADYGKTVSDATSVTSHSLNLTGLAPNTLYYFRVQSTGAGQSTSATGTFVTSPAGTPRVQIASYTFVRSGADLFVDVTLSNPGTGMAKNVQITSAALGSKATAITPVAYPDIAVNGAQAVSYALRFKADDFPANTKTTLAIQGSYDGGTFNSTFRVTVP